LKSGLYTDRAEFGRQRWYRVDVLPGQELRASVSVAADRAVRPDYGVLMRAVTVHGREIVRGEATGNGRTDVLSTGLRHPEPGRGVVAARRAGRDRRQGRSARRVAGPLAVRGLEDPLRRAPRGVGPALPARGGAAAPAAADSSASPEASGDGAGASPAGRSLR